MIHQHHHPRHHYAYTHYIPYIILAIAVIALVVLLANMVIPQISTAPVSKVIPPIIPQKEAASINFTSGLDSRSLGVAGGGFILNRASLLPPTEQSMSASDRYSYNLSGEAVPGRLETSSGFRADAIPYQAKPWLQPAVKQGFRADAIPYQAKPWLQPAVKQGFRADVIPYQAKPWLQPAVKQGFRADAIPYQAKPWLKQDAQARAAQQSMSAADRYGYNLTGKSVPGRLPATQDNLISPLNVDQHTRNLIAQYVPGLLSTQPYFEEENYGYNYFKQHLNNDR